MDRLKNDVLAIFSRIANYQAAGGASSVVALTPAEFATLREAIFTRQSLSQEAVRDEVQRVYTKADMEAACELALAGYRSKPMLDKMVDRFLAWPLPDSACADLIATRQGPGRIGTNLLNATEARQMLEHVLKREPNAAARETDSEVTSISSDRVRTPAPAAPVAEMVMVPRELPAIAQKMAEAVRWIIRDAAYKAPEQIGDIAERWITRLHEIEEFANAVLSAAEAEGRKG